MAPDGNNAPRDAAGSDARALPSAVEMEQLVLGAMILSKPAISKAIGILSDGAAFYHARHRLIYRTIVGFYEQDIAVDLPMLVQELDSDGKLEECGGIPYLSDVAASAGTSVNVEQHAQVVLERSIRRRLISLSEQVRVESYDLSTEVHDVMERFEERIFRLSSDENREGFVPLDIILHRTYEQIERVSRHEGDVIGVPSGFKRLDQLTAGFQKGELIIVAARPGMGKTSFVLNVARNAAVQYNQPVGIFSLEMSAESVAQRFLCMEGGINAQAVRTGQLLESDWNRLSLAVQSLSDAQIYIDDCPNLTPLEVRAKGRRLVHEHNVQLLIVDYLQLMRMPRAAEGRQQEVAEISRNLKALSKDLSIPIIACSQVTRDVEKRGDPRPKLSDLRESGSIEQDADVVMFVHRPEYYKRSEDEDGRSLQGVAEIIVEKQRNGPTGSLYLRWVGSHGAFDEKLPDEFFEQMGVDGDEEPYAEDYSEYGDESADEDTPW